MKKWQQMIQIQLPERMFWPVVFGDSHRNNASGELTVWLILLSTWSVIIPLLSQNRCKNRLPRCLSRAPVLNIGMLWDNREVPEHAGSWATPPFNSDLIGPTEDLPLEFLQVSGWLQWARSPGSGLSYSGLQGPLSHIQGVISPKTITYVFIFGSH